MLEKVSTGARDSIHANQGAGQGGHLHVEAAYGKGRCGARVLCSSTEPRSP